MNVEQMRAELAKKYSLDFVKKMKDSQVMATYMRLKRKNQI